jgi:IclR family transcriptional regulator, mhp operon transcriptional activator
MTEAITETLNDEAMTNEPVRPIRALLRGLEALHALNRRDGLTVTEVADWAKLPRTTAYRILETLRHGGFVIRDEMDDRYRPTLQVRVLSEGAESEAWIRQGAAPIVNKLGKVLLWPIGLWTMDGDVMRLRAATDRTSPLALVRKAPGETMPVLRCAAGLAVLACESAQQRELHAADLPYTQAGFPSMDALENRLARVRTDGFVFDPQVREGEIAIAVPVVDADGVTVAAATVRFIRSALSDQRAMAELLPKLQAAAEEMTIAMRGLVASSGASRGQRAIGGRA